VEQTPASAPQFPSDGARPKPSLARSFLRVAGRRVIQWMDRVHELGAFFLIALGVTATKFNVASRVIRPLMRVQIYRAGVCLLPMIGFLGCALGLIIVGQTVSLLTRVGAHSYIGTLMVTVVIRELGPLLTTVVVLARVGAATVVELGTSRAQGEVEVLESLGIDPVHYLVVPRMWGLAVAVFALTVYFVLIGLLSGYVFAFLQDVPMHPSEYFHQLAAAVRWEDFVLLTLKTIAFGTIIAVVCCYQGLARPLRIEEVPHATTRAVVSSVVACVLLDALFIVVYLLI
jgi:phospholipid/cholesterol/gamma-HCH transport system permease protein